MDSYDRFDLYYRFREKAQASGDVQLRTVVVEISCDKDFKVIPCTAEIEVRFWDRVEKGGHFADRIKPFLAAILPEYNRTVLGNDRLECGYIEVE